MLNLRKLIFHRPLNITTSGLVKISSRNESTSRTSSSRSIWDKLLNFPKGFKNYYPKGKGNEKATEGGLEKIINMIYIFNTFYIYFNLHFTFNEI